MSGFTRKISVDYYGTCVVRLYNISNRSHITVTNGRTIFSSVPYDPFGSWMNICIEVPLLPGDNVLNIPTRYMVWKGQNYTKAYFEPKKYFDNAVVTDLRKVCYIKDNVIECNHDAILVPYSRYPVWGGSPYYNTCSPGYCIGNFLMHAPCRHEIYSLSGDRLVKRPLSQMLDFSKSYAIVNAVPKIDRDRTFLIIDGRKYIPGEYTVKYGTSVGYNVMITGVSDGVVVLYDKKSNSEIIKSSITPKKAVTGEFTIKNDMYLEVRLYYKGKLVDKYG